MSELRNCAFQYAEITGKIFSKTEIICDEVELTLSEAKELWNKYYPRLAKHIKDGEAGEMALWINMIDKYSYGEPLQHIIPDAESDGINIWETRKTYFTKSFNLDE